MKASVRALACLQGLLAAARVFLDSYQQLPVDEGPVAAQAMGQPLRINGKPRVQLSAAGDYGLGDPIS